MSNLFQTLEMEAFRKGITPRTAESRDWFRKKAQSLRRVNRNTIMKEDPIELKSTFQPGAMAMFFYNPKTKDKLPYYDSFPLTVVVDKAPGGFYGLNLHYLPPMLRAKFLDVLLDNTNNKYYDETTRLKMNYQTLASATKFKEFKPCIKHYLTGQMRSRLIYINPTEWDVALFLPTARFVGATQAQVFKDSRKIIRG